MNQAKELEDLYQIFLRRTEGIKPGLDRIHNAWHHLGPHHVPAVLIGGTNGKGSTSGFLWSLLSSVHCPSGLFTSPHLCNFYERIQVNHFKIDDSFLSTKLVELRAKLPREIESNLSFFEIATLLARLSFEATKTQINIWEVGMGGRWDATNINKPIASAITSIDLDHEQWLGADIKAICSEKIEIARSHRPLFWGEQRDAINKLALPVVFAKRDEIAFNLVQAGKHFGITGNNIWLSIPGLPEHTVKLPKWFAIRPKVLQENFAIAAAIFYYLVYEHQDFLTSTQNIQAEYVFQKGIDHFFAPDLPWPPSLLGRFQKMTVKSEESKLQHVLVDVCHNPASAARLCESLKQLSSQSLPKPALVSMLADKDINSMLDQLRTVLSPIVLFLNESERSMRFEQLAERHQDLIQFPSFEKAWAHLAKTINPDTELVLCGSIVAIGQILRKLDAKAHLREGECTLEGHFGKEGS